MKLWDKIKELLGIDRPKQIAEPKYDQYEEENGWGESIQVNEEYLQQSRAKQLQEKERDFQLMFALKNVCGKKMNLVGEDLKTTLQNTLNRYGYESQLCLDNLDFAILSKANNNLNLSSSEALSEYMNNSDMPIEETKMLIDAARAEAIEAAKSWGYNENEAHRYVPSNVISVFEQTIEEINKGDDPREN